MLLAHDAAVVPRDLWGAWTLDLTLVVPIVATVLVYASTVRRLWRTGGRGVAISRRQVVWFALAVLTLVVALVSPLDALGDALFWAHMVQHLLLVVVAAPLLLLGRAHLALVPVLPVSWRRRGGRRLARTVRRFPVALIVAAVTLHVLTVVAWHVPGLYDLAVRNAAVHILEHATLLASALAFWTAMGAARPRPAAAAAAGFSAFVTSLSFVLLAAAMTVAASPWYTSHLATTRAWGLTPLQDQQLAAAIMWVPGGLVYLAAAAAVVYRWIRADERRLALQRGTAAGSP